MTENKRVKLLVVGTHQGHAWAEELQKETDRCVHICDCLDMEMLKTLVKEHGGNLQDCLVVAETDEAAQAAGRLGVSCIGYCNPKLPEQSFQGISLLLEGFDEIDWQFLDQVHTRALGFPVVIAETEHLWIREMALSDLDDLYRIYDEKEIKRFVPPLLADRKEEETRTQAYIQYMYGIYQYGMWVLLEKESRKLIGRAGFGIADYRGASEIDLGYLMDASFRGKGYATEACMAVLKYGRDVLGFDRVVAYIHEENHASKAVVSRLNFRLEGNVTTDEGELSYYVKEWSKEQGDLSIDT